MNMILKVCSICSFYVATLSFAGSGNMKVELGLEFALNEHHLHMGKDEELKYVLGNNTMQLSRVFFLIC